MIKISSVLRDNSTRAATDPQFSPLLESATEFKSTASSFKAGSLSKLSSSSLHVTSISILGTCSSSRLSLASSLPLFLCAPRSGVRGSLITSLSEFPIPISDRVPSGEVFSTVLLPVRDSHSKGYPSLSVLARFSSIPSLKHEFLCSANCSNSTTESFSPGGTLSLSASSLEEMPSRPAIPASSTTKSFSLVLSSFLAASSCSPKSVSPMILPGAEEFPITFPCSVIKLSAEDKLRVISSAPRRSPLLSESRSQAFDSSWFKTNEL